MAKLRDYVVKIRSKNAGPFWVTVDIFCETTDNFERVREALKLSAISEIYKVSENSVKRFDLADLNVIKISFPRPIVQGHALDRDQHGAQYALLLGNLELD